MDFEKSSHLKKTEWVLPCYLLDNYFFNQFVNNFSSHFYAK